MGPDAERAVCADIEARRDEIVDLLSQLIAFDTTARPTADAPARDERRLQELLAGRLSAAGAVVDLWEPLPEDVAGTPMVPEPPAFHGRPQLAARFPGSGGGRSLMFNGHIDVVDAEPREDWTSDPHLAAVRDDLVFGRGACDMKGGIAAMVAAAEALARMGGQLAGDLTVCTVTDEESTGAGGLAAVRHGVRADAAIVTEPTGLDVWRACRGTLLPTVTVHGRPGHAGIPQRDWRDGGAVNAIERMLPLLDAMRRFQEDWRQRDGHRHDVLSPGEIVLCELNGGEWIVSYPARCTASWHLAYLPAHSEADGWAAGLRDEIEAAIASAAASDAWLVEHPPVVQWGSEVPAAEVPAGSPIVQLPLQAARELGRDARVGGLDNWHDGATFTRLGGTPSVCFGPGRIEAAHTVDEHVPVQDLVDVAKTLAVTALRFCADPVDRSR